MPEATQIAVKRRRIGMSKSGSSSSVSATVSSRTASRSQGKSQGSSASHAKLRPEQQCAPTAAVSEASKLCKTLAKCLEDAHAAAAEAHDADSSKGNSAATTVRSLATKALVLTTDIKRVVRMSNRNCLTASDATAKEREVLDANHLQLQNVLYEKLHVEKEIRRCEQFQSRHRDIVLANTENDVENDVSPHETMLASLNSELKERKRLQKMVAELKEKRKLLTVENDEKAEKMKQLPEYLNSILSAAKPVVEFFAEHNEADCGMSSAGQSVDDTATYLPQPLFLLHACARDYGTIHGGVTVSISGDLVEAKSFALEAQSQRLDSSEDNDMQDDDDAEVDDDDDDERPQRRGKGVKNTEKSVSKSSLLQKHPLSVRLRVQGSGAPGDDALGVSLTFAYLPHLQVVTVTSRIDQGFKGASTKDATESLTYPNDHTMSYLYPEDTGSAPPTIASAFKLDEVLADEADNDGVFVAERAYKWAQSICGIDAPDVSVTSAGARLQRQGLVRVIADIRDHLVSTQALAKHIDTLKTRSILIDHDTEARLFPLKATSKFAMWRARSSPAASPMLFDATFEDKTTALQLCALVTVSLVYPLVAPEVSLSLTSADGSPRTTPSDIANMRAIEREVNAHYDELYTDDGVDAITTSAYRRSLLVLQMRRLQMCFDIFCRTEVVGAQDSDSGPTLGKIFERGVKGRDRIRPYVFDPASGMLVHRA
eukprot:m.1205661 g.1205661  ORF g.1205661 m.1205661 type:complete len:713 (+) comp24583_c0_seq4:71-2209(+)